MKYYLGCEYDTTIGLDNDDGDGSDWSSYNHEVMENHQFTLSKEKVDYPEMSFDTDIEKPYIVAVIYSDGGTFGRTDGYVQYFGPFEKSFAEQLASTISGSSDDINKQKELKKLLGKDSYFAWTGYFASLQDVVLITT